MEEKQVTINELVARMLQEMKRVGYAEEAIYRNYYPKIRTVARYYTTAKIAYYSVASTEEYVKYHGRI
ncbi:MAG: hypothetical protein K6G63_03940 [Eubacterium sp.]|nr:hypothetical protein [Eubacterium sp.]